MKQSTLFLSVVSVVGSLSVLACARGSVPGDDPDEVVEEPTAASPAKTTSGSSGTSSGKSSSSSTSSSSSSGSTSSSGATSSSSTSSSGVIPNGCYAAKSSTGSVYRGNAVNAQGVCSSSQIVTATNACSMAPTDPACVQFQTANPSCARCMFGLAPGEAPALRTTNPQPSVFDPTGSGNSYPNTFACAAAVIGQPALAQPLNDFYSCAYENCSRCSDETEMDKCFMDAQNGACSSFANAAAAAQHALMSSQSRWETPCGATQGSIDQAFAAIAQTVCGQ